jgi:hypothetical protein
MCAFVARLTYVIDISSILNLRGRKLRSLNVGNTNRLSRFDRSPPRRFAEELSASAAESAARHPWTGAGTDSSVSPVHRARHARPPALLGQRAAIGTRCNSNLHSYDTGSPRLPKELLLCRHLDRPRSLNQISQVSLFRCPRWAEMLRPPAREQARQALPPPDELQLEPRGDSPFPLPILRACPHPQ